MKRGKGTRSFLVMWYLGYLSYGAVQSAVINRLMPFADDAWILHAFTWTAIAGIILLGNHMATGSVLLRGLRDWP